MTDDVPRRRDDIVIAELTQKFEDFVQRYERDNAEAREWRKTYEAEQKLNSDLLNEIAPNYRRGLWIISVVVVGSMGLAVKTFWSHIAWK